MTAAEQEAADVDRGLEIYAQVKKLGDEMKGILARLMERALKGEQIPLEDPEREGMQYIAKGSNGVTVPVIITADMVQKSFKNNSATHAKLKEIAKDHLPEFYKEQVVWKLICKDGKALRREAAATLGDDAPAFVSACLARDKHKVPKTAVKVQWSRDEEDEEGDE